MECKSIQSSSSSSTTMKYDVFVSFRGEDTRYNFTDHLFAAFQRKGIVAFRDDTNLRQGDHISTELMQAIEGSQVLIVVFSKNYATSSWCLQELAKIMDCIKVPTGQSVLPVFYDVSPSEVRKQSGDYGIAFAEHEQRFKHDLQMVQRWREALVQAANLSGWDVQNKPQNIEIEKIIERVWNKVDCSLSSLDGLVGMPPRLEQVEKLLDFESIDDVRVVGICGMGGIGKTTLARAVYDKNFHRYGATCFIDDVSKVYRVRGPIGVQKQLICQTLNEENQQIWNISKATHLIKSRLRRLKTFIVLDNVDKIEQLENLSVDRECLCAGSRIIIISRDRQILNNYGVDEVYDVELLNMDDARQLFCKKAFKRDYIMSCDDLSREYELLTDMALNYAQCLPLALKVLGSFLFSKNIPEWQSALDRLKDNPNKDIMNVLQISFDGLEPSEKEIFLDIACFFNSEHVEVVEPILRCCGFHPEIGIKVLIDKSLITISVFSIIMHDKLQELGMKIVRQNAPNEPWKWSRIWLQEDFRISMSQKMEMDNLEAIQCSKAIKENTTLRAEPLSKMNRLRLLILKNGNFSGSLNNLSNDFQYLYWKNYPFTYFPSSCELIKLVELHLPCSSIKQLWEGKKLLYNLKIVDLHGSKNLVKTPDFSGIPNLERLDLEGCMELVHIHPSIGNLTKLVHLNLRNCTSLSYLPTSIFGSSSLEVVLLEGCSKLFHSELAENARQGISDTAIQCQSTSSIFKRLKLMLPFHFFNHRRHDDTVDSLMPSLSRFQCLRELDLSFCNLLDIPNAMVLLGCLERLSLRGNNFVILPRVISDLPRLIHLNLEHCRQLTSLFEFPLHANLPVRRRGLVRWNGNDAGLSIFDCPKLAEMEGWTNVALSWMIQFLKFHVESSPCIAIVIPGAYVPSWFNIRRDGGSIATGAFPNVQDNNWIGFAFCAAFVAQYDPCSLSGERPRVYCGFGGNGYGWFLNETEIIEADEITAELTHLCLVLLTRQQLWQFYQCCLRLTGCLERLSLRGNNFVTLPRVVNDLPRLIYLNLEHCRQLTSLYEFPLHANLPVPRRGLARWYEENAGLSIFDCPKLAEMESWTSVALSWMIQFLKFHVESSPCIAIVIPGAHVPSWFNIRRDGGSIKIGAFPNVQDNNWIGFAFCAAFVARYVPRSLSGERPKVYCNFRNESCSWTLNKIEIIEADEITAELTHLCLVLLTRQQVIHFIQYYKNLDHFLFKLRATAGNLHLEVKHCGLRVVFKQDLEEFKDDK